MRFCWSEASMIIASMVSMFHPLVLCILLLGVSALDSEDSQDPDSCYPPFGCFPNSEEFSHSLYRPVNLHPESPRVLDTKLHVFSRWLHLSSKSDSDQSMPITLGGRFKPCSFLLSDLLHEDKLDSKLSKLAETIKQQQSNMSGGGEEWTAFIVHGFLDNLDEHSWMTTMRDRLMGLQDNNSQGGGGGGGDDDDDHRRHYSLVVLVDWKGGNHMPYLQATANARLVGAQIAFFIQRLHKWLGLEIWRTHIIGHSLGAHIAGYAGKRLQSSTGPQLGRVSALDPAGPNFHGMPKAVRVDRDDALFVDVIHTNGKPLYLFGLGIHEALGHVDFYPNGGSDQPGCELSGWRNAIERLVVTGSPSPSLWSLPLLPGLEHVSRVTSNLLVCSHTRAIAYYLESITLPSLARQELPQCRFTSRPANNSTDIDPTTLYNSNLTLSSANDFPIMGFESYRWFERIKKLNNLRQDSFPLKFYLQTNSESLYCKT